MRGSSSAESAGQTEAAATSRARRGGGRERVLGAARELFAEHGVSGTSLQMIADRLGVTKAAVYHQFHAKRDIELALLEPVMDYLKELVTRAEAVGEAERRGVLVAGIVDLFIAERQTFGGLHRDPGLGQVVAEDEEWTALTGRLAELLLGTEPDVRTRVALTMLGAGLSAVVLEPTLHELPDDELREAMATAAARLLG